MGNPVNFDNLIYPYLTYTRYYKNKTTGFYDYDSTHSKIIETQPCNNATGNVTEFIQDYNISQWFCPDWLTNYNNSFGGAWDDDYVFYYSLSIDYCPGNNGYSKQGNCTDIDTLSESLLKQGFYISILYPRYTLDPNNIENPLQIKFVNYYYMLNLALQKTDRVYYKFAHMKDDKGWIFSDIIDRDIITFSRMTSDFKLFDTKYYELEGNSATFYAMVMYFDRDYDLVFRSYMKFQNLCADVGGCLKIVMTLFGIIAYFHNINSRKNLMYYELFDMSANGLSNSDMYSKKKSHK